jgi:putative tricarboxylic transport membrane protein
MASAVLHNLSAGLTQVLTPSNLLFVVLGAFIGVLFGVIPGIATPVVLSVMLVFTYHTSLGGTIALFLGTYAGSYFSASITSILLNTPAHPEAFAVTFDGYPMARRGQAARALGISAASTCIGGLVGCIALAAFLPALNSLPLLFHPPEYVALIVLAMFMIAMLGCDSVPKAIISTGLGFMVASVGTSQITGFFRYTFHSNDLTGGFSLIAVALGVFAVPQMVMVFGTGTAVARQDMHGREVGDAVPATLGANSGRQVLGGIGDAVRRMRLQVQSGLVGVVTGIVPGIGGFAANFLSYGLAQQTSRKRDEFGTGIPEGIVAAEGSSLAKEAGSLIPILGLGIPGSVGGALFLAALVIKGVVVGYGFTDRYPVLPFLARVTRVPGPILVPFILTLSVIGPYLSDVTFTSVIEVAAFTFIGLALRRLGYPVATFVLGLVLGPTFETNIYLTRGLYPGFSFITARPIADVIVLIGIAVPVVRTVLARRRLRRGGEEAARTTLAAKGRRANARRYPVLGLVTTVALVAVSIWYVVYGATHYNFATATMPVFGGLLVLVPSLWRLPIDIYHFAHREEEAAGFSGAPVGTPVAPRPDAPPGALLTATAVETEQPAPRYADIKLNAWGRRGQFTREIVALVWLLALVELVYLVGFLWALPIFCAAYGLVATGRYLSRWYWRATFAVTSAAVMWAIAFEGMHALHIAFYPLLAVPS